MTTKGQKLRLSVAARKAGILVFKVTGGFIVSIAMAFLYYILWSSVFMTDEQKRLEQQNRLLREAIPQVRDKVELLSDEIIFLRGRDETLYRQVFDAEAPSVSDLRTDFLPEEGQTLETTLIKRAAEHSQKALSRADSVEMAWRRIFDTLTVGKSPLPPLLTPVKDLTYTNMGASVGDRMNPFYKMKVKHDGLDIIAAAQTPVYATASGYVTEVKTSKGGKGNMVEITHPGGYRTRYAHLNDVAVKKGRHVRAGTLVGHVGDSGRSFATHLHYELRKDTLVLDPVHHFFGSIGPQEYLKMQIVSLSSGQSMD